MITYEAPPRPIAIPQVMYDIAECESQNEQFEADGTVLMNKEGSSATGRWQIVASIHNETALSMGLDIRTATGNRDYALYLYKTKGVQPWKASAPCHGYK